VTDNPLISCLMPAYNCENYIDQAVASVVNQTLEDWELLIVDDGSSDGTLNKAIEWAKNDKRVKVIRSSHVGYAEAWNISMSAASGEFIARQDADDFCTNDRFATMIQYARITGIATCKMIVVNMDGNPLSGCPIGTAMRQCDYMRGRGWGPPSATIVARSTICGLAHPLSAAYSVTADSEWTIRVLRSGYTKWHHVNRALYFYRQHPNQSTKLYLPEAQRLHRALLKGG